MIEFKNIFKTFDKRLILNDLSFMLNKGEKLLVKGKSGLGKSTIFNLLLRFEMPDSGEILINSININDYPSAKLRKMFSWLPQKLNSLGDGTILELLTTALLEERNNYSLEIELVIYFEKLSLDSSLLKASFSELSGGELQRMGIIAAKLLGREVILLDEPTAALDKETAEAAMELLLDGEASIICISHSSEFDSKFDIVINLKSELISD